VRGLPNTRRCRRLAGILIATLLTSLLNACTVSSSQWTALQGAFKTAEDELAPYRWQVTRGDYQGQVIAVALTEGKTLFANRAEDVIAFDGWMITEVKGLGLRSEQWMIEGAVGERQFADGKWPMNKHQCEAWRVPQELPLSTYRQDCVGDDNVSYTNRIDLDKAGQIVRIEQNIGLQEGFPNNTLVLEKR
jgi:hypothetical protein